jgi:hypothetical protein
VPGLARGCHHRAYMYEFLSLCRLGKAAFTFGLQFSQGTSKAGNDVFHPGECTNAVRLGALGSTQCSVALISQAFTVVQKPCGDRARTPDRVAMQTLAAGRTYHWAKHHFLWEAKYYLRVRLDDIGWCLPTSLPSGNLWLAFNNVHMFGSVSKRVLAWVSDRYGVASAEMAPLYFGAWQIWRAGVFCSASANACFEAPARVTRLNMMNSAKRWLMPRLPTEALTLCPHRRFRQMPRGETALTSWLHNFEGVELLSVASSSGNNLVRQVNTTHAFLITGTHFSTPVSALLANHTLSGTSLLSYADIAARRRSALRASLTCKVVKQPIVHSTRRYTGIYD